MDSLRERLTRFASEVQTRRHIVTCMRCGSTDLDQNSLGRLVCYNCRNTAEWDGTKFAIVRYNEGDTFKNVLDEFGGMMSAIDWYIREHGGTPEAAMARVRQCEKTFGATG